MAGLSCHTREGRRRRGRGCVCVYMLVTCPYVPLGLVGGFPPSTADMQTHGSPSVWIFLLVADLWLLLPSEGIQAVTHPGDVAAMMQVKASIDPSTIHPSSCLASWDFSVDPCENRFKETFMCGFDCAVVPSTDGIQRVTSLQLDSAGYGGTLSPWIGNLSALQVLKVSGNALAGPLPNSIGRLSQLVLLDVSYNMFDGNVPACVQGLVNLQTLNLAGNRFEGQLPASLNSLMQLTELRFEENRFSGHLPDFSNLVQLQYFDASDNHFSGSLMQRSLPSSLCSVCLRNNLLSGKVPKAILALEQLNVLDLSGNRLVGCVGDMLLAHPSLQQLNLSSNRFSQLRVHPKRAADSQLVALDLSYNVITGPLPAFFTRMKHLSSLSLRYNFLNGLIPPEYAVKVVPRAVGVQPLERLLLDGNYLSGTLPAPFMDMFSEHRLTASFVDNCLQNCPPRYDFCQGGLQKAETICRLFNTSP